MSIVTYNSILTSMLSQISDEYDKREGSIIYNALAPAASQLSSLYGNLESLIAQTYPDTASKRFLIYRGWERGLEYRTATYVKVQATLSETVSVGTKFTNNTYQYEVTEIDDTTAILTCETAGTEPNSYTGSITQVSGNVTGTIDKILKYALDDEDIDEFRLRYFNSIEGASFGGNIEAYKELFESLDYVLGAKIIPNWNTKVTPNITQAGYVHAIVIGDNYSSLSSDIIEELQNEVCPNNSNNGYGLVPIGHNVTIESVESIPCQFKTNIEVKNGYTLQSLYKKIKETLQDYYTELKSQWLNDDETLTLRINHFEAKLLGVEGVLNCTNGTSYLRKQGGEWTNEDIALSKNQIPSFDIDEEKVNSDINSSTALTSLPYIERYYYTKGTADTVVTLSNPSVTDTIYSTDSLETAYYKLKKLNSYKGTFNIDSTDTYVGGTYIYGENDVTAQSGTGKGSITNLEESKNYEIDLDSNEENYFVRAKNENIYALDYISVIYSNTWDTYYNNLKSEGLIDSWEYKNGSRYVFRKRNCVPLYFVTNSNTVSQIEQLVNGGSGFGSSCLGIGQTISCKIFNRPTTYKLSTNSVVTNNFSASDTHEYRLYIVFLLNSIITEYVHSKIINNNYNYYTTYDYSVDEIKELTSYKKLVEVMKSNPNNKEYSIVDFTFGDGNKEFTIPELTLPYMSMNNI